MAVFTVLKEFAWKNHLSEWNAFCLFSWWRGINYCCQCEWESFPSYDFLMHNHKLHWSFFRCWSVELKNPVFHYLVTMQIIFFFFLFLFLHSVWKLFQNSTALPEDGHTSEVLKVWCSRMYIICCFITNSQQPAGTIMCSELWSFA